jgi:hypothetical protein
LGGLRFEDAQLVSPPILRTLAQLLGGSAGDVDHFDGGVGFDTMVVLVDEATRLVEQPKVPSTLGKTYTIESMNLTINGIEKIVFTTQFGFDDVTLPGGELGARLHEADLGPAGISWTPRTFCNTHLRCARMG